MLQATMMRVDGRYQLRINLPISHTFLSAFSAYIGSDEVLYNALDLSPGGEASRLRGQRLAGPNLPNSCKAHLYSSLLLSRDHPEEALSQTMRR